MFAVAILYQLTSKLPGDLSNKAYVIELSLRHEHPTQGREAYYAKPGGHRSRALKLCSFSDP
jgi:hypothetical protein